MPWRLVWSGLVVVGLGKTVLSKVNAEVVSKVLDRFGNLEANTKNYKVKHLSLFGAVFIFVSDDHVVGVWFFHDFSDAVSDVADSPLTFCPVVVLFQNLCRPPSCP